MGNYQVISISSNVKEFLGFTNNELRGQSINKLIPRVYHAVHDQMIDKILNKKDS
jgi:PAS domain S-box-containing protein